MSDPASISPVTIAMGGVELPVQLIAGQVETVKVALLPISKYARFFSLLMTEERLAEFLCDKPEGWADTLHPDSLMDIVEKGTDLNFSPARRWAERRAKWDEAALAMAEKVPAMKATLANSAPTAASPSAVAPPPK